jgi:hypothetical protein
VVNIDPFLDQENIRKNKRKIYKSVNYKADDFDLINKITQNYYRNVYYKDQINLHIKKIFLHSNFNLLMSELLTSRFQ